MMDITFWMQEPLVIRGVSLYLPAILVVLLWLWRNPQPREATGTFLAVLWAFPALLALHMMAIWFGWWHFEAEGGLMAGMPVEFLVGWVLVWAMIPSLLPHRWSISLICAAIIGLDLLLMPYLAPVLQLGHQWILGEIIGVIWVTIPALLVARWTITDSHLVGRVGIQIVTFSLLLFWFLPMIGMEWGVVDWSILWERPHWQLSLVLPILALPGLIGLSAVQEFAVRGHGTPLPLDPPKRLVITGIYAYVANPMQIAGSVMILALGFALQSFWLIMGGLATCIYSLGIANWSERDELQTRFGEAWQRYRSNVRKWRFRWRPWVSTTSGTSSDAQPSGILYTARDCAACSQVRAWFENQQPIGLALALAEQHPSKDLTRITYESVDGEFRVTGIAALARGLEHIHFGWALAGCALRLPVVHQLVQLLVDASGGGPLLVERETNRETAKAQHSSLISSS